MPKNNPSSSSQSDGNPRQDDAIAAEDAQRQRFQLAQRQMGAAQQHQMQLIQEHRRFQNLRAAHQQNLMYVQTQHNPHHASVMPVVHTMHPPSTQNVTANTAVAAAALAGQASWQLQLQQRARRALQQAPRRPAGDVAPAPSTTTAGASGSGNTAISSTDAARTISFMTSQGLNPSDTAIASVLPNFHALNDILNNNFSASATNQTLAASGRASSASVASTASRGSSPAKQQSAKQPANQQAGPTSPLAPEKLAVNEHKIRRNMLQVYGHEHPVFYDQLVNTVGKEAADTIINEAVNETCLEKEGGEVDGKVSAAGKSKGVQRGAKKGAEGRKTMGQYRETKDVISIDDSDEDDDVEEEILLAASRVAAQDQAAKLGLHGGGKKKRRADEGGTAAATQQRASKRAAILNDGTMGNTINYLLGRQGQLAPAAASTQERKSPPISPRDPPGFDQFKEDPEFCTLILAATDKSVSEINEAITRTTGRLFLQGLTNMTDDMLRGNDADPTVRAYVKDVIGPYFKIPPDLVCPSKAGTNWNAFVNITSQNVNEFARNVIYHRRKSMKSGVDLAIHEIGGKDTSSGVKPPGAKAAKDDGKKAEGDRLGEAKIKALQKELSRAKSKHAKHAREITALKELHKKETEENEKKYKREAEENERKYKTEAEEKEKKYTDFVANLIKSHRKEIKSMQNVHKTFLESYVEASLDALRSASESPTL